MTQDYTDYPSLSHLYLEDSYVVDVVEDSAELKFILEAVLTPEHPRYHEPAKNEQYCYLDGVLVFAPVARVEWLKRSFREYKDVSGTADLGNIDSLTNSDGVYSVEGDWGMVRIWSSADPQFIEQARGRP